MRILYLTDRLSLRGGADQHLLQVITTAVASGASVSVAYGRSEVAALPSGVKEVQRVKGFDVPMGYYFHDGHAWARIESGGYIRIGLDDFALKVLGKADALDLPLMGKELDQGVGYLDDGTMVVVDNARKLLGKNVDVTVTSVLQTTAGKMIFGKAIDSTNHSGNESRKRPI